jgi:serine/threonine-protein kinase
MTARPETNLATAREVPHALLAPAGEHALRDELPSAGIVGRLLNDRYAPVARIAEDTYSVRYRADDLSTGESVCIEFLPRRAIGCYPRIRHAVDKIAALGDPNIVEISGRGVVGGVWPFLVTEDVAARGLRDVLRDGGELELAQVVRIAVQCAEALVAAHAVGVLHGALHPERIVASMASGRLGSVRVCGFGIAPLVESSREALWSGAAELHRYASPEHVEGRRLEPRSDVYSLGVILEELCALAGVPLRSRRPSSGVPHALAARVLDKIVGRCLAPLPGDRYASAADLALDLARLDAALAPAPRPARAPSLTGRVELRPAQYPPKSRSGLPALPKVIVRSA